jgi:uncharacterized protein DUF4386
MYRSRLVPRGMAVLGLVGGPLICLSGIAVVLDIIGKGSAAQTIATVPEFLWELSLGIHLLAKGFKASPLLDESRTPERERAPSTPRWRRSNASKAAPALLLARVAAAGSHAEPA